MKFTDNMQAMTDHFSILAPNTKPKIIPIAEMLQAAFQHYNSGRLPQSEQLLRQILNAQPKNAHALHLLGIIAHQSEKNNMAIQLITQAIAATPNIAEFHSNLAEIYRLSALYNEALIHAEKAVSLAPKSASAQSNLGLAYYDMGNIEKAETCQKEALKLDPKLPAALNNLGSILRDRKDKQGAIAYYREVLATNPNHPDALNNLGALLTETEQPEEALPYLLKAVQFMPRYAEAHHNIGNTFLALEQLERAVFAYQQALKHKPDYAEAWLGIARVYQEQSNLKQAESAIEQAIILKADKVEMYVTQGEIMLLSGYPEKAEAAYAKALSMDPASVNALLGKGHLRIEQGHLKEAESLFREALSLDADHLGARLALTQVTKATPEDENMKSLVASCEALDTMLEPKQMSLHFALGKCYDDTKEHTAAFEHYAKACALKRKRLSYSADNTDQTGKNIRAFFNHDTIERLSGGGSDSTLPIFILGMPRSGTTLTEQIIASHPLVHGAGELPDLMQIACEPRGTATIGYPVSLNDITQPEMKMLGERYVSQLQARNPNASRITDKMPANFNALGLIHLMLPNAKIIHVKRNPVDTCLSGFTRLFQSSQYHSYDLVEIGRYYMNYHAMMQHWREVLPQGAFYEVQYEDLVADTEGQARALIDYCGLEWNENCLEFYKHERGIRTASVTQVRQPIYTSSVARWRPYEAQLKPLLDVLGDLVE